MNTCTTCGTTENLFVYTRKKNEDGTVRYNYYMCTECNTARAKKYRKTSNGKKATSEQRARYSEKNPERVKAWRAAQILENKPCEICGKSPAHKHHPNVKRPLFVIHLCPYHHRQAHKTNDMTEAVGHPGYYSKR